MANKSAGEPNALDIASSSACTRSGAFALLLSLALASLIPYWLELKEDAVLGKYLSLRLELATQIELLDDSGTWQEYRASHGDAESTPLAQLVTSTVEIGKVITKGTDPKAVTMATVATVSGIDEVQRAADFLVQLDDSDMLTRSRTYSNFFNMSVYRWVSKRGTLIYRNEGASYGSGGPSDCLRAAISGEAQQAHEEVANFVPAVGKEMLLRCLTLRDVRELATFELPTIPDTTKYSGRGGKQVDVAPGTLPRNLYMASLFAAGLLLFVVVYFSAFVREAVSSPTFPAQGTIFGAFSRPFWILAIFALALWAPVAASIGVAVVSRKLPLTLCSVLMGGATLSSHAVLHRKSYFAALNPLRLIRKGAG
jgi:hypothetical protein